MESYPLISGVLLVISNITTLTSYKPLVYLMKDQSEKKIYSACALLEFA